MAVFVDAGSAANANCSSQLLFLVILIDEDNNTNIIHYGSIKAKRIAGSVLAVELFAVVEGFDVPSTIRLTINAMTGRVVPFTSIRIHAAYTIDSFA